MSIISYFIMAESMPSRSPEKEQGHTRINETQEQKNLLLTQIDATVEKYLATPLWYPPQMSPCSRFLDDVSKALHEADARQDDKNFNSRRGVLQEAVAYCQFCADTQKEPLKTALNNKDLMALINVGDIKKIDQKEVKRVVKTILTNKGGEMDLTPLHKMMSALDGLIDGLHGSLRLPNPPDTVGLTLSMSTQALDQLKTFKDEVEKMEREKAKKEDDEEMKRLQKRLEIF